MSAWHGLFISTDEAAPVASALLEALALYGYTPYDPFPGGNGTPPGYKTFVRQFVSPARNGWVRILGTPDLDSVRSLSARWPIVYGLLDGDAGEWQVIHNGDASADAAAFTSYLKSNVTPDAFARVASGQISVVPDTPEARGKSGMALPPDVEQLARERGVNPRQADRLVERMTGQVFGRLNRGSGGEAGALRGQAQALIRGSSPDWESKAGQRLRAIAALLTLPADWRTPTWEDVRDAYQTARRLARNPKASLLPGEREALDALPIAAQYVPVYVGKA
ncbi:MAG: hypothetical protein ACYDBJ_17485 [Aggregatilineales bacterium]